MKVNSIILCIIMIITADLNSQDRQDLKMPTDTTIFHKMCNVDDYFWAVDYGNGEVFKSEDNGESWKLIWETDGEYLEAIQFIDKETGYLCGDYGLIMKSTDGGLTWLEIGPQYAPRITKDNSMEKDSAAAKRYYYNMYFKDKDHGLVWGFELKPLMGRRGSKSFFYITENGGESWNLIEYKRAERDSIITDYFNGFISEGKDVFGTYKYKGKAYQFSRDAIGISVDQQNTWKIYPLPLLSDDRYMLRTLNFINNDQGYIFGGDLEEESQGFILETLDGGKSWRNMDTDLAHIHYSVQKNDEIWYAGKESILKKWKPKEKADSTFVHKGNTSRIMIDGIANKNEWLGANKTNIKKGFDLFTLQDDHYLYLSTQYDTAEFKNYYCDLYIDLENDSLLNIHASQQLGDRILADTSWTDKEPSFDWGYIKGWTANKINFDRRKKVYMPTNAMEFQISKDNLLNDKLKIGLQCRDIEWQQEVINVPESGNFKSTEDWLLFYFDN